MESNLERKELLRLRGEVNAHMFLLMLLVECLELSGITNRVELRAGIAELTSDPDVRSTMSEEQIALVEKSALMILAPQKKRAAKAEETDRNPPL